MPTVSELPMVTPGEGAGVSTMLAGGISEKLRERQSSVLEPFDLPDFPHDGVLALFTVLAQVTVGEAGAAQSPPKVQW